MSSDLKNMLLSKVASSRPREDFGLMEAVVRKEERELEEERRLWKELPNKDGKEELEEERAVWKKFGM